MSRRVALSALLCSLLSVGPSACSPGATAYRAQIGELHVSELEDGLRFTQQIRLQHVESGTISTMDTDLRLQQIKGTMTGRWTSSTINHQGHKILLEHDDERKELQVTVDDHSPIEVNQRPDDHFVHGGRIYDRDTELHDLAVAIADDLERDRASEESVFAAIETTRHVQAVAEDEAKLFLGFFFTDVMTDVGGIYVSPVVQVGVGNTNQQNF